MWDTVVNLLIFLGAVLAICALLVGVAYLIVRAWAVVAGCLAFTIGCLVFVGVLAGLVVILGGSGYLAVTEGWVSGLSFLLVASLGFVLIVTVFSIGGSLIDGILSAANLARDEAKRRRQAQGRHAHPGAEKTLDTKGTEEISQGEQRRSNPP